MRSRAENSSRFGSSSSTIASMTRSQSARSCQLRRQAEPAERGIPLCRREPALLDAAGQVPIDGVASPLGDVERNFAADSLVPGLDADLRDTRAHRAQADDSDLPDLRRHG